MTVNRGCEITGWGTALPDHVAHNEDFIRLFDTSDDWIVERSGIHSRRLATGPLVPGVDSSLPSTGLGTTGNLAVTAGRAALRRAGWRADEVELIIVSTMTPDQTIPATSAPVAAALGITAGAIDLNVACAGFTYVLIMAAGMIAGGMDRVLVIGADTMSRAVDWRDRSTAVLFGDGAGAVALEVTAGHGSLLGWDLGVDGTLNGILYADHGSGMVMKGPEVFRRAVVATTESAILALEKAKVGVEDVRLFVPHQANLRMMQAVAQRLGLPDDRIASVIEHTGNTSSASIPLTLAAAADAGRLHEGDVILFAGFGAGMSWATAVWRWSA